MTIAELFAWLTKPLAPVEAEVLTIEQSFSRTFRTEVAAAVAEAKPIETEAASLVHTAEKEITMSLTQAENDIIARLTSAFSSHTNESAALQQQVSDLTAAGKTKDDQIAALTQQLSDANSHLAEFEAAVAAAVPASDVPAPAPTSAPAADGSASADVTP